MALITIHSRSAADINANLYVLKYYMTGKHFKVQWLWFLVTIFGKSTESDLLHEELLGHKISRKDFQKLSLLLYFVCYFDKEPKYRYSRSIFLYVSRESKEKEVA